MLFRKGSKLSLSNPGILLPWLIVWLQTTAIFPTYSLLLTLLHKLWFLPFLAMHLPTPPIPDSEFLFCQILSLQLYRLFPYSSDPLPSCSK